MEETGRNRGPEDRSDVLSSEPRYPTNHVVAAVADTEQVTAVVNDLAEAGFDEAAIEVACGREMADALEANTGRSGLSHVAIRVAERLGLADDEMELKDRYEQALRNGRILIAVPTDSDEEKQRAAGVLREHGAESINFMGRFTIETLDRGV